MKENVPLVSVVMSVYNAGKYLDEAIQSILKQTYKKFEFIIINDGSTDSSLEIIKNYKKEDNRIVLISRENKGLIFSLNEGIQRANGKYIARMDADDISLVTRFQEQVNFLEKNTDIGVCGSWIEIFGENRKSTIWKLPYKDNDLKARLLFSVPFAHPSIMMRKEIIDKYGLKYDENYKAAEDYKFWLDMSKYTKFANIPNVLLRYRYLETSISRIADNRQDDERFKTLSNIFIEILNKLGITSSERELRLHFCLMKNDRVIDDNISLFCIWKYLIKIIKFNVKAKCFNGWYLIKFLALKFINILFIKVRFFLSLKKRE